MLFLIFHLHSNFLVEIEYNIVQYLTKIFSADLSGLLKKGIIFDNFESISKYFRSDVSVLFEKFEKGAGEM